VRTAGAWRRGCWPTSWPWTATPRGTSRPCAACGGVLRRKYSRVAVRYEGWGFSSTDKLISDKAGPRKSFTELRQRAERISDE